MTTAELLSLLSRQAINLQVVDGRLRYHAPKSAMTPEILRLLKEHKESILKHLAGDSAGRADLQPLSYNQQLLWFQYHFAPQSSAYNVAFVARVVSPINLSGVKAAFQSIVDRHPMLRTTYDLVDGRPTMKIHSGVELECEPIDAAEWSEDELIRKVHVEYGKPFDLARGPVLRVQLFTRAPEDHVLLLTIHHIACDGGSIGILLNEFRDLYSGKSPLDLTPVGAPYTDYVRHQKGMLEGPEGKALGDFWMKRLEGLPAPLSLPVDKKPALRTAPGGGTRHFSIAGDLYRRIVALSKDSGATLYTFLLASFQTLLMRVSAQDDIVIGTPMSSRPRKEDEYAVGCYINPVVLRGSVTANKLFVDFLRETRETFTRAFEHRHFPFPLLVERLSPERDPNRSPVFQVMFNLLNRRTLGDVADLLYRDPEGAQSATAVDFGRLKMKPFPMDQEEGQFDLMLEMIDNGNSLTGLLKYGADLFEDATIARMSRHFLTLLQAIVDQPSRRLGDFPLIAESELKVLLDDWNRTAADYPRDVCLQTLFERRVEAAPEAVAVIFEDRSLTYRELNVRANRLAHRLLSLGVGPESLVGVCFERSLDMVIALYAILKAGGAYVPLDPEYPIQRLEFMADEIKAPVVVTQRKFKGIFPGLAPTVLCLDEPDAGLRPREERFEQNPESGVRPDNAAYVIYTSGSTGNPKGVVNTHRGICNRIFWMQETFPLSSRDAILQKTPFSFDVSVWEFFWPLMAGARLVVASPGGHRDSDYLVKTIVEREITTIHFVPSMLQVFLENKKAVSCAGLKRVICSGEALTYELQENFFRVLKSELHNLYGPTEAAVDVTWWACRAGDRRRIVPIGKPVANTRIYILDPRLQPVPVGVAGELHIGGVQVARGYLNRPELTSGKFLPDPFQPEPGAKLYKTGDLCRYLPDGNVEFLGRNDFQVKIRGLRIELGEIEAGLRQYPGVRDAVVIVREDVPGDKRLAGYIVSASSSPLDDRELRSFLKSRLADFMVPASITVLDAFPLTPNGKIDRPALPTPEPPRPAGRIHIPPRGETERQIARIWRELLRSEDVGLDDNFFDAGGHSLLLIRLAARLREEFARDLPIVSLFQHPTVREQARLFGAEEPGGPDGAAATPTPGTPSPVAVIGMSCRFPGAPDYSRFWQNLREGIESIRFFSEEELEAMGLSAEVYGAPNFVRAAPVLEDIDKFDAAFFGYSPREAAVMDPQHRLFLEGAWNALEDAGCDPASFGGAIGVFGGVGPNYYAGCLSKDDEGNVAEIYQRELGNEGDYLTTRVSYKLNLKGPSYAVQTACSTSLVAVHIACQNLLNRQCDVAIAGGVSVNVRIKGGYFYQEGLIPSPDGHCRAFDARAKGTVVGQGVGIVVLKRLADALTDGDSIRAIIRGSAVNNDGAARVGFTAPSVEGQAAVIRSAQAAAGVSPAEIGYIETHGTGTPLGDPIEIEALTRVFRPSVDEGYACAIGSVKTNIGHLDAAAGIAGFIKIILMLENRQIPPSLHFETPNPDLRLETSPFRVQTGLSDWTSGSGPLRAAVSSFGLGGTNAHVILEEAPRRETSPSARDHHLLVFSAKTEEALEALSDRFRSFLRKTGDAEIANAAYTLQTGRKPFEHRRTLVCRNADEALNALDSAERKSASTSLCDLGHREVAFMFTGQGAQYVNMGFDLYRSEPVFREAVERCAGILRPELEADLRDILYPASDRRENAEALLGRTSITQPALFAVEFALARLWMSWGIEPKAFVGHSLGEYTAACLAGVFSLEDSLRLVATRGRLMQAMPPGRMLAVQIPEKELLPLMSFPLALAAVNAPSLCVVSGAEEDLRRLESVLTRNQVSHRRIPTSHAFHSPMMDPVLEPFAEHVLRAGPKPPKIPFLSNVTGTWITDAQATDSAYWASHLRRTVRFADCVREWLGQPGRILIEAGPGRTLTTLALRHSSRNRDHLVLPSTRHPQEGKSDLNVILETLAALWRAGVSVDWKGFHASEQRTRIPLPVYPFKRNRHWIEPLQPETSRAIRAVSAGSAVRDPDGFPEEGVRGLHPEETGSSRAPQTEMEKSLAVIWKEHLGIKEIGLDDNFFDLGGHSLVAVSILGRIAKAFGPNLPLASLIQAPTIRLFARMLGEASPKASWSSLVPLSESGTKPPLFLMHSHGGNVLEYLPLVHRLGASRPVYALQAKGLDGSPIEEPRIEEMATRYLKEIKSVQPRGPYYLGGFCFGGFLAIEAARQLLSVNERVALVIMINSSTMDYPRYTKLSSKIRPLFALGYRLALEGSGFKEKSPHKAYIHFLSRVRRIIDLLHARLESRFPSRLSNQQGSIQGHSLIYHLEHLAAAHDRAWEAYQVEPYEGDVLFFKAKRQPFGIHPDPLLGWKGLLMGKVNIHEVPGFRQTMLDDRNVQPMASILGKALDLRDHDVLQ